MRSCAHLYSSQLDLTSMLNKVGQSPNLTHFIEHTNEAANFIQGEVIECNHTIPPPLHKGTNLLQRQTSRHSKYKS